MPYDPDDVRAHYDRYGEREWHRLEASVQGRIKYAIHRDVLLRAVRSGSRVLDIGCGPGRFAIDLINAGATVTLADISPRQLDLARQSLQAAGLLDRITGTHVADVTGLSEFADERFDLVVCFGGAVSYVCERYPDALSELVRVTRKGGRVLVSVMSLYGTLRLIGPLDAASFLDDPDRHLDWPAILEGRPIVCSRPGSPEFHLPMCLFSSTGLSDALEDAGLVVESLAAANPIVPTNAGLPHISDSETASSALERLERALATSPGLVDTGEHLIATARRPA